MRAVPFELALFVFVGIAAGYCLGRAHALYLRRRPEEIRSAMHAQAGQLRAMTDAEFETAQRMLRNMP
jgi:hypothetical protein